MAEQRWVPLREYAEARGVTPAAILKAIKRGRLGLPHRRSNTDARGSYEILADVTEPPQAVVVADNTVIVADRSETPPSAPPPEPAELLALRDHLATLMAERDRLLAERDQERERLEQAGKDHAAERDRLMRQIETLSAKMGGLAREAQRAPAAEAEATNLRAELDRLKGRGWLARIFNL
jgi:hypothetical protein